MAIKPRRDSFIGIHFDFHANDDCNEIGKTTTEEMLQTMIDKVKPEFVQCDCKGHRGLASYPTKVGYQAPGFVQDNLRIWREVTQKNNIPLYMHYSGVWDTEAVRRHHDWATITAEGEVHPNMTSVFGPYNDQLMIPQIKELIDEYQVDGIWVDGDNWALVNDYSEKAVAEFTKETGITEIPKNKDDRNWAGYCEFMRRSFKKFVAHYTDELHAYAPGFQITSNWIYSSHMPEKPEVDVDYLSGDSSLQDSYNENRLEARCMAPQGLPWDIMSWAFCSIQMEGVPTTKTAVQLKQEASAIISLGGGFQAYFKQKRDGSIQLWEMDMMGEVTAFCRERRDYCFRARQVPQVALLNSTYDFYKTTDTLYGNWTLWGGHLKALKGNLMNLLDNQYSVEVVQEHHLKGRMADYPLIVLPETKNITAEFKAELLDYVKHGGKLLLIGPKAAQLFEEEAGVVFEQHCTEEVEADFAEKTALVPKNVSAINWKIAKYSDQYRLFNYVDVNGHLGGFKTIGIKVAPKEGTETLTVSYGLNDFVGETYPAVTVAKFGEGEIGAIWLNVGERYLNAKTSMSRDLMGMVAGRLFSDPKVTVKGSHMVDVILNEKDGKLMVNLINTGNNGNPKVYVYDELLPIPDLEVSVKLSEAPEKVSLQPGNRTLPYSFKDGVLTCKLDRLDIYDIIVIE